LAELAQLDWIAIISRWAHILAAITAVGGTIFCKYAVGENDLARLSGIGA